MPCAGDLEGMLRALGVGLSGPASEQDVASWPLCHSLRNSDGAKWANVAFWAQTLNKIFADGEIRPRVSIPSTTTNSWADHYTFFYKAPRIRRKQISKEGLSLSALIWGACLFLIGTETKAPGVAAFGEATPFDSG